MRRRWSDLEIGTGSPSPAWGILATLATVAAATLLVYPQRGREETERVLGELRELSAERDRIEAEAIDAGALRRSDELRSTAP